jgi:hypothetical protein
MVNWRLSYMRCALSINAGVILGLRPPVRPRARAEALDKIAQLAKRTIPGASEVSVTLLQGEKAPTAAFRPDRRRCLL